MEFIAFDFETANTRADSVCSLGLVHYIDGQEVDSFYTLINPNQFFDPNNIAIHGITPDMVEQAPTFIEAYGAIRQFMGFKTLVAHNAKFDVHCLTACIKHAALQRINNPYFCTMLLSRASQKLRRNSLSALTNHFNVTLDHHHNALADARACGEIAVKLLEPFQGEIKPFLEKYNYQMGTVFGPSFASKTSQKAHAKAPVIFPKKELVPLSKKLNPNSPFFGKHVCFTGRLVDISRQQAAQLVVDIGGFFDQQITIVTMFLVVADSDWRTIGTSQQSSKIEAAKRMEGYGREIYTISESQFKELCLEFPPIYE